MVGPLGIGIGGGGGGGGGAFTGDVLLGGVALGTGGGGGRSFGIGSGVAWCEWGLFERLKLSLRASM